MGKRVIVFLLYFYKSYFVKILQGKKYTIQKYFDFIKASNILIL